jgi:hypothetical protein
MGPESRLVKFIMNLGKSWIISTNMNYLLC